MRLSAALAYYSLFSIAPLLIIVISIVGLVFGEKAAQGQISAEIQKLAGEQAGHAIEALAKSAHHRTEGIAAAVIGVIVLLLGASGVFGELKRSLNDVWGVQATPGQGVAGVVRDRFLSFAMVLGIGFLLLISLVVSAGVTAVGVFFRQILPIPPWVLQLGDVAVSLVIISSLFACIWARAVSHRVTAPLDR